MPYVERIGYEKNEHESTESARIMIEWKKYL